MTKIDGPSLHPTEQFSHAAKPRLAQSMGVAILLLTTAAAAAQTQPAPARRCRMGMRSTRRRTWAATWSVSPAAEPMYDTLVNIQSGPRVLGETFTMHAVEGTKHPLLDSLSAFSSGFGGDPNNFAKLDFSKGKLYEFSGMFRRDRQYSDYDLLANPDNSGQTVPYGVVNTVPTAAALTWPQNNDSPVMFNTVRRMTDTNLTVLPLSKVSFRAGYSQNIFQGPTLSPARSVGKYDSLAMEVQRNSTDDFTGAIDWKPVQHTKLTFEEQVTHYKADSYFTLNPNGFLAQEADGTPVSLGDWDALSAPYSISACNTASMGSAYSGSGSTLTYTIFSAPQTPGGLPIVNPACDVITSYLRSQPTRIDLPHRDAPPSELKHPEHRHERRHPLHHRQHQSAQLLRELDGPGRGDPLGDVYGQRERAAAGCLASTMASSWQATKTIALSDQIDFSNVHQPGVSNISAGITQNTPTNPNETINYSGALGPGSAFSITGNPNGTPLDGLLWPVVSDQ